MKKTLVMFTLIFSTLLLSCQNSQYSNEISSKIKIVTPDDITEHRDAIYLKGESKPFTGTLKMFIEKKGTSLEMEFKNGFRNGIVKHYENGILNEEVHYKNDKKNGLFKSFYKNGKVKLEVPYKNDKKWGTQTKYYETGEVESTIIYKDGAKFYTAKFYAKDGKLKKTIYFDVNKMIRRTEFSYYNNGKIKTELTYSTKEASYGIGVYSETKYYSEDGKLTNVLISKIPYRDTGGDLMGRKILMTDEIID